MAMTKVKNLQLWCKKMTDGYRDVDVKDMTTSWKDGFPYDQQPTGVRDITNLPGSRFRFVTSCNTLLYNF